MKRLALLAVLCAASPIAAELNVVAKLDDPRIGERRVYLRCTWLAYPANGAPWGGPTSYEVYLPKEDAPSEIVWELVFENAEVMRQALQVGKHNKTGTKVLIRGREVETLRGRGLLVESIKSNW